MPRVGVREHIKRAARRMGYEVRQYTPLRSYTAARERLFTSLGIDVVVDVGANAGQYGELLRGLGFRGRLISLEPVPEAFAALERIAAADGRWSALQVAAADVDGEIELRVTADSRSSSVLARNDRFADRPGWAPREVVAVPARRLATLVPELLQPRERAHLKVDVQGYERQVLEGADGALDRFDSLELELNVSPLYDGQAQLVDLLPLLTERGIPHGLARADPARRPGPADRARRPVRARRVTVPPAVGVPGTRARAGRDVTAADRPARDERRARRRRDAAAGPRAWATRASGSGRRCWRSSASPATSGRWASTASPSSAPPRSPSPRPRGWARSCSCGSR